MTAERLVHLEALEAKVKQIVAQKGDDHCWRDILVDLAGMVGVPFDPEPLPREVHLANCARFHDSLTGGPPYVKPAAAEVLRCEDCGRPYRDFPLDTVLSDAHWLLIHPAGEGGVLCPHCIAARGSKVGATCMFAWFDLPDGPADGPARTVEAVVHGGDPICPEFAGPRSVAGYAGRSFHSDEYVDWLEERLYALECQLVDLQAARPGLCYAHTGGLARADFRDDPPEPEP